MPQAEPPTPVQEDSTARPETATHSNNERLGGRAASHGTPKPGRAGRPRRQRSASAPSTCTARGTARPRAARHTNSERRVRPRRPASLGTPQPGPLGPAPTTACHIRTLAKPHMQQVPPGNHTARHATTDAADRPGPACRTPRPGRSEPPGDSMPHPHSGRAAYGQRAAWPRRSRMHAMTRHAWRPAATRARWPAAGQPSQQQVTSARQANCTCSADPPGIRYAAWPSEPQGHLEPGPLGPGPDDSMPHPHPGQTAYAGGQHGLAQPGISTANVP